MPKMRTRISGELDAFGIWIKPETGDPDGPLLNPTAHWDKVRFHSELRYLNDALSENGLELTHQSVAGRTGTGYIAPETGSGNEKVGNGRIAYQSQTLFTHSLGYIPFFNVRWGGQVLYPGTPIYSDRASGHYRFASAYATSSVIGIRTIGVSGKTALPAQDVEYDVTVVRAPAKVPGAPLAHLHVDADSPIIFGHGRVTSDMVPLRRVGVGDIVAMQYPISPCVDARGGTIRAITIEGVTDFGGSFYSGSLIAAQFINLAK